MTDPERIFYSLHAQKVMADRNVDPAEVEAVIRKPEVSYKGSDRRRPHNRIVQSADLAVVIAPVQQDTAWLVVTILWRTTEDWNNDEMKGGRA